MLYSHDAIKLRVFVKIKKTSAKESRQSKKLELQSVFLIQYLPAGFLITSARTLAA